MKSQQSSIISVSLLSICMVLIITGCLSLLKDIQIVIAKSASTSQNDPFGYTVYIPLLNNGPFIVYIPLLNRDYPEKNIFGVQLDTITSANGLDQMVKAKSNWTRRDFVWQLVEPVEGQRNWGAVKYYEDELVTAAQHDINVIVILLGTPQWASATANVSCGGKVKPEKLIALANFTHDLVYRYSQPPYNVKYFEMWNEPDVDGFLGCWGDANDHLYYGGASYGEMLKAVYPRAKAANSSAQILVGGLLLDCDPALGLGKSCTPAYFLKGILESGALNSFDGVAFHSGDYYSGEIGKYNNPNFAAAWNTTGPTTALKANFLKKLLSQYNASGKYLVGTEAGIKCKSDRCPDPTYGFEVTKAYYIVQDGATALAGGLTANIWFSVYGDSFSGLITKDNQPLPAYYAFQFMRNKFANHSFVQNITTYSGIKGYEFQSSTGKKLWLLWSLDGATHQVTLPSSPLNLDMISTSGNATSLPISTSVSIGIAPVFVQY